MRNKRFKKLRRYVPHFISVVVLVGMVNQFFNPFVGLYGNIYKMMFVYKCARPAFKSNLILHLYVWSGVWQNMGWDSIIYLAALSSVSPDLHEAAQMDGASRLRRVISIDLPAIMPTIILLLIINAGQVMNLGFEKYILCKMM